MIQVTPVILCGGSGARLWPLSRAGFPKQFLSLTGNESLFQQAAQRLIALGADDIQVAKPLIVTGEEHRFLASEQLREVGIELGAALLEPVGRNTAPALTLAALAAQQNGFDPVLVVTPADQTVANSAVFTLAMQQAVRQAEKGSIVILGIKPDRPETGYGYIQTSPSLRGEVEAIHSVQRFVEKPDATTAQQYLAEGGYYWNAGMFVLKASVWLKALEQFRPDILQVTQVAWEARSTDANPATPFVRPGKAEFNVIPSESIDYAVMERCPGSAFPIHMVPLDAGWSDLGVWDAVWNVLPKDEHGNAHVGDVLTTHSRNTLVHASSRLVSLVGVENLIVVETRFYQASTSELYGLVQEIPQKETTPFYPRSPYAVAKMYAYWIVVNYREAYGLYACNGILFNHESPRRGETFVTRKITRGLANIAQGLDECLYMGNLDALRDWGHAKDYVRMQWMMLQQEQPEDFVIATGVQYSVRQFIQWSAQELGITLRFEGQGVDEVAMVDKIEGHNAPALEVGQAIVKIDPRYFRPTEVETLLGDPSKAKAKLGWMPEITVQQMCHEMVANDLQEAQRHALLKANGYQVNVSVE